MFYRPILAFYLVGTLTSCDAGSTNQQRAAAESSAASENAEATADEVSIEDHQRAEEELLTTERLLEEEGIDLGEVKLSLTDRVYGHLSITPDNEYQVIYSKNFATCVHLLEADTKRITHVQNHFCQRYENKTMTPSSFTVALSPGKKYVFCHGNNYNVCSAPRSPTRQPDRVNLYSLSRGDQGLTVYYYKNFKTCVHMTKPDGSKPLRQNFLCGEPGRFHRTTIPTEAFPEGDLRQNASFKICHGNNGNICSPTRGVTFENFHNFEEPLDVNGSGSFTSLDVLNMSGFVIANGGVCRIFSRSSVFVYCPESNSGTRYIRPSGLFNPNNDNIISASDTLMLINAMNSNQ